MGHSYEVTTAKVSDQTEWCSTLSMKEALRVLNDHKTELAELPGSIFPAISTLVINSHQGAAAEPRPTDLPFVELREIANLETSRLTSRFERINELLNAKSGKKFQSSAEIQDVVGSIQSIVRRGSFDLVLSEKVLNLESGTRVSVSSEKPAHGYPVGRMVVLPLGQPEASKRRVSLFPLKISAKAEKQAMADQVEQLSEIADLSTPEVKAHFTKMNKLLLNLAGKNFQSHDQIAQLVDSLQLIMRRGEFDLKLTEEVLRWKKGTKVYVSLKTPSNGYPIGRMGVYPVGAPSDARHRVNCFPFELSPKDR